MVTHSGNNKTLCRPRYIKIYIKTYEFRKYNLTQQHTQIDVRSQHCFTLRFQKKSSVSAVIDEHIIIVMRSH